MSAKRRDIQHAREEHHLPEPNRVAYEHGPGPRINGVFLWSPVRPNELVLWGGETTLDGSRSQSSMPRFVGDLALYDIKERAWRVLSARGPQPAARAAAQAALVDNGRAAVVFGGESQGMLADSSAGRKKRKADDIFVHYSDTWLLDIGDEPAWRMLPMRRHPSARSGHRMASVDGVRFAALFGGFHDVGSGARYLDDLWLFDAVAAEWTGVVSFESGPVSRPAARSGAVFQRVACETLSDGAMSVSLLLVGGYCMQTLPGAKEPAGVVLGDQWLLTLRIPAAVNSGADVVCAWRQLRPPRMGQPLACLSGGESTAAHEPDAKASRSGRSAIACAPGAMLFCGGVMDEEDAAGECILGTCTNGLAVLAYDHGRAEWRPCANAPLPADMCPRFGPMMAAVPRGEATDVYVLGGALEVGERQIVLDDMHAVHLSSDGQWCAECVQPLSSALAGCHLLAPESDSEGSDSSGSDVSDSDCFEDSCDSESEEESRADDPATYKTLKAFFDATAQHWLAEARREAAVAQSVLSEKDVRMRAFALARERWDAHAQASDLLDDADLGLGKRRH